VKKLLLNCDMGESFGAWTMGLDDQVMEHVDCANIACGFHASDPSVMRKTVSLALKHDVRIGAHPAYPDLVGFGRRSMQCSPQEVTDLLHYQIGALDGICRAQGGQVSYVKPHGALYNDMMQNPDLLRTVMQAIAAYSPTLQLMLLARRNNQPTRDLAADCGVGLLFEAFADRAYDRQGYLVTRSEPGAVLHDAEQVVAQAIKLASGQALIANDGSELLLEADTLCVHGDNPAAVDAVRRIRAALG
tara:strand:+ start:24094 stop:24831 length:738 start_codon:yes stop_codon:yes gene_type:complete